MHKSWFTWLFIVAAVVMVFITFNYQSGKDAVPLSEIFPDEEIMPVDVEYEYVQEDVARSNGQAAAVIPDNVPAEKVIAVEAKEQIVPVREIKPPDGDTNFTVQIASFKDKKRAEESLVRIRKNVPSAYIGKRDLGAKGIWYRIYAGQFNLRSEAEMSLSNIKRNYNDSFIISPKRVK